MGMLSRKKGIMYEAFDNEIFDASDEHVQELENESASGQHAKGT